VTDDLNFRTNEVLIIVVINVRGVEVIHLKAKHQREKIITWNNKIFIFKSWQI